jgi:hypothetical protein
MGYLPLGRVGLVVAKFEGEQVEVSGGSGDRLLITTLRGLARTVDNPPEIPLTRTGNRTRDPMHPKNPFKAALNAIASVVFPRGRRKVRVAMGEEGLSDLHIRSRM